MPDISSNLGLNLPKGSDTFDYDVFLRQNFQKIDDQLKANITETFTASAGQTVVTLVHSYIPGAGALSVEVDGVPQYVGSGYTETDSNTITFTEGLNSGAPIKVTILGLVPANDERFNGIESSLADKMPQITDLTILKASTYPVGKIIRVLIDDYTNGFYKITSTGSDNGYSMIKLNNNTYASRIYETYNEWLNNVKGGLFAYHKGFNARIEPQATPGVVPSNSTLSYELSGQLGSKMIETDTQVLADGTWVISHDSTTAPFLSGTSANLDTITLDDFKSRTLIKEYTAAGGYWNYSGELADQSPMTLEEGLRIAAKYGLYVLLEIKIPVTHAYTDVDWQNLASIIKKTGMEEKVVIFSGTQLNTIKAMKYLPNGIAGLFFPADTSYFATQLYSFKNFLAICSNATYDSTKKDFCESNKVPLNVWTIDDYETANSLIADGVDIVTTNTLLNNPDLSKYSVVNRYTTERFFDTYGGFTETKGDGTSSIDANNIISLTTTTYIGRRLTLTGSTLKRGDIVRLRATAKTVSSNGTNVARISISNKQSGTSLREHMVKFPKNEYETKEIYYIVNENVEDLTVSIGQEGQSLTGQSDTRFKSVEVAVLSRSDAMASSNERFAMFSSFTGAVVFRPSTVNKGIKSVYTETDKSILCIDYIPFKNWKGNPVVFTQVTDYGSNFQRKLIPVTDNTTNGTIRLKIYNSDGTQVTDASTALNMAFSVMIKNF